MSNWNTYDWRKALATPKPPVNYKFVAMDWRIRDKANSTWSPFEDRVRSDVAERLLKALNATDKLMIYRLRKL